MTERLPDIHPGEVVIEEFLKPLGLSRNRVAREIGVPPRHINEIVLAKRAITPDTALRLARYFGTSERFWLGLQTDYDLEEARLELPGYERWIPATEPESGHSGKKPSRPITSQKSPVSDVD